MIPPCKIRLPEQNREAISDKIQKIAVAYGYKKSCGSFPDTKYLYLNKRNEILSSRHNTEKMFLEVKLPVHRWQDFIKSYGNVLVGKEVKMPPADAVPAGFKQVFINELMFQRDIAGSELTKNEQDYKNRQLLKSQPVETKKIGLIDGRPLGSPWVGN